MDRKRKLYVLLLSVCLFSMTACGKKDAADHSEEIAASVQGEENTVKNEEEENEVDREESSAKEEKINIDDIVWEVDEGIIDGDRFILLNYTNNTPYTIASFEITFKEKSDITEEEKETYCSDLKEEFSAQDDEVEKLRNEPISMRTESKIVCNAGEAVTNVKCLYYSGYYYVKNINHYKLVEPDIATIRYVDDTDHICTVYYDYNSNKYSFDSKTDVACQWPQTDLGSVIPKPDTKIVETGISDDKSFMFDARGMSLEQFNDYVDECMEMGYTVEVMSHEGFFSADNSDGYNIYLYYAEDDRTMSASVSAPEENVSPVAIEDNEKEEHGEESEDKDDVNEELVDGMRPEFKEAMDSYEEFYSEYCDILKKYNENPSDMELLTDYTNVMTKSAEMTEKFNAWENDDLNSAELAYYLDVNNRVMKKLLEVSE